MPVFHVVVDAANSQTQHAAYREVPQLGDERALQPIGAGVWLLYTALQQFDVDLRLRAILTEPDHERVSVTPLMPGDLDTLPPEDATWAEPRMRWA